MRESFIVRIDSDVPARIWSGVGDLFVPMDAIEPEDSIYSGAAELLDLPDFQQLINGLAERIDVKISGVPNAAAVQATQESSTVEGRAFHIGTVQFDDAYQMIGTIQWIAQYRIDTLTVDSNDNGIGSDAGRTRTISLSLGSDDTGRSRAPVSFFTDADQRRRSSTDKIFDHVGGIELGTSRRFGPSDS